MAKIDWAKNIKKAKNLIELEIAVSVLPPVIRKRLQSKIKSKEKELKKPK